MKMLSTGRVSLLGLVLASVGVSYAARETTLTTAGGISFTGVRYDDGRDKPYRIKFRQDDLRSVYMFNSVTQITDIKVGTERYKVLYDNSAYVESVELTSSTRRGLARDDKDSVAITGRRLEFVDCSVCEEAWYALCAGVRGVCDFADYGSPFSATASASVEATCENFCDRSGESACFEQCQEVDSRTKSCLDPSNGAYKCTFSGDTSMIFSDCGLTDADVPSLPACFEEFGKTNIQTLRLYESAITAIADGTFAGLSEMTFLDLQSNKLVIVPEGLFDGLTKLERLDLARNDLASLPEGVFSDLESLKTLRLSSNELTAESLPIGLFAGVPQLKELSLDRNELEDMTSLVGLFDGLTELKNLDLSLSGVKIVPEGVFAGLTKLETLSFWTNGLSSLPDGLFSDLTALQTLDLTGNGLTDVGTSLSGLTELRILHLEYNNLPITEDTFSGLVNLEVLDLQGNGMTTNTPPGGLQTSLTSSLSGLEGLRALNLGFTDLLLTEDMFSGLANLETLHLFGSELTSFPEGLLSDLTSLKSLDLGHNNLLLTEDTFSGLVSLETLDLMDNGLTTFPEGLFSDLTALKSLSLRRNELLLTQDSFSGLVSLELLNLRDSGLTTLLAGTFAPLGSLVELELGSNDLLLPEDVFSGLGNLEILDLRGCGLTTLPAGVFSPLVNLVDIDLLSNGDLQCIPSSTATEFALDSSTSGFGLNPVFNNVRESTCGCTPAEAVFCDEGFTCQSGMAGYTCE